MPDQSSFDSSFNLVSMFIKICFVVVGLLIVFGVIRAITFRGRRRRILLDAGLDPRMASVQMEARLANSALLASANSASANSAAKTVEERLAELESLHGRGVISAEELHEARAKVLGG